MGDLNITKSSSIYKVNCLICNLTACTSTYNKNKTILVVRYIPHLLVPTNFTGIRYHDKSLQVIKEGKGLLVAGIMAAISAIATMAMASMALSQSTQNAHYVNTPRMSPMPSNKCQKKKKLMSA
jgi:hypothetical protein